MKGHLHYTDEITVSCALGRVGKRYIADCETCSLSINGECTGPDILSTGKNAPCCTAYRAVQQLKKLYKPDPYTLNDLVEKFRK